MKIFSLATKKHLVGWALILGFATGLLVHNNTFEGNACIAVVGIGACPVGFAGWPLRYTLVHANKLVTSDVVIQEFYLAVLDFIFWILIVFVVLSFIKYFRKKRKISL